MKKIAVPILEVSNLCKKEKKKVVDRLNISVARGDSIAILCKNDGNAELLTELLGGKTNPEKGKIFFKGDDVTGEKNIFGVVAKKANFPKTKTVTDISATPIVKRGLSRSMASILVKKELSAFGLEDYGDKTTALLPKNIALRAELFSAYMCSHELMVINEPFNSLKEDERSAEFEWLLSVKSNTKLSLVVITQSVDTAVKLADSVMVVNDKTESVGIISIDRRKMEKTLEKINELYNQA